MVSQMSNKSRILFDARFLTRQPNGISTDSSAILHHLLEWSNRITLLTDNRNQEIIRQLYPAKKQFYVGNFRIAILKSLVKRKKVDDCFDYVFFSQFYPIRLKHKSNTKVIYRVHDFFPITNPEWFKFNQKLSFWLGIRNSNSSNFFLFNSNFTAEIALRFKKFTKFQLLSCPTFAFNLEPCKKCKICLEGLPHKKYALTVGTLEPRKNYGALINFWIPIFKAVDIPLIIVANSGWKHASHAKNNDASGLIHVSNLCEFGLNQLYSKTFLYIAPSLAEGFDIPAVLAKKYNCFVLASDIPVHREILGKDNRIKFISPNFDKNSHREVIDFLRDIRPINQFFDIDLEKRVWAEEFQRSINSLV